MRRRTPAQVVVKNPSKGLLTHIPPDLSSEEAGQFIVSGENVRAARGVLKAAPGVERVHTVDKNIDQPANMIFQSEITAVDPETRTTPIIGTGNKVYAVRRRSRELVCSDCETTFAVLGDSGSIKVSGDGTVPLKEVSDLIKSWSPDFIVHVGDLVYADGGAGDDENPYEAYVARFFSDYIGGYRGVFGTGPTSNKFFPTLGNHDWTDGPEYRYLNAFFLPRPETYYTVKKGPVQFFFINSYGNGPDGQGPGYATVGGTGAADGVGESDLSWATGPQAAWLREQIALSDTTWRVVVFHHPAHTSEQNYFPGYSVMDWPWQDIGVDLVLNGHAHVYERLYINGVPRVICGLGGQSRRSFVNGLGFEVLTTEAGIPITDESGNPILLGYGVEGSSPPYSEEGIAGSVFRYSEDYGALRMTADRTSLVGKFYTRDGDLIDTFTLSAQRSSDSCYILDSAQAVSSLEIVPESITTEVGGQYQLIAYAYSADGSREDVTDKAAWSVADVGVASVAAGKLTGQTPGSTVVTATWGGMSDTSTVEVLVQCVDEPLDLMLILDESFSMWDASGSSTRIERLKQAANLAVDAMNSGPGDRIGAVAFSGDYLNQTPYTRIVASLGAPSDEIRSGIAGLVPSGATGIATGLLVGGSQLMVDSDQTGSRRKVAVLFTDGFANVTEQSLVPWSGDAFADAAEASSIAAQRLKDEGVTLMVVALDLRYNPDKEAHIRSLATEGFYYHADNADELLGIFSNLLGDLCRNGYYYQTTTPLAVGTSLL